MTPADAALVLSAGVGAGLINAVAGGGSLLLFPAMVATGMGTLPANVTNSIAVWPGYFATLAGMGPDSRKQLPDARALAPVTVVGTVVGCVLLLTTPDRAFDLVVPVLILVATALIGLQPRITRLVKPHERHPAELQVAVGLAAVWGGYFGAALGVILLAALGLALGKPLREANAIKLMLAGLVATVTVAIFAVWGPVDWAVLAAAIPGVIVGGLLGGRLARRVDEELLRRGIVVIGIAVAVWLFARAI